jgi:hypothetical protein
MSRLFNTYEEFRKTFPNATSVVYIHAFRPGYPVVDRWVHDADFASVSYGFLTALVEQNYTIIISDNAMEN